MSEGDKKSAGDLVASLEAAYAHFQEAYLQLHGACSGVAEGLVEAENGRIQATQESEEVKGQIAQARVELQMAQEESQKRITELEAEVAALRDAHQEAIGANAALDAVGAEQNQRIGEMEGTIAALQNQINDVTLERDAHGQHAAAVEMELVQLRDEIGKRPGLDYLGAIEQEKNRLFEELSQVRVENELLRSALAQAREETDKLSKAMVDAKTDNERLRREAENAKAAARAVNSKMTSSSTKLQAITAAPPPAPEAKAFGAQATKPAQKPPGALDLDELMNRAKTVKDNGAS
ncbi:MAG TPA: hypothetical protein VFF73_15980 [Planctomycetota bacterium]|nr:hypothetical protein [Planctomycetota bacterium]